MYKMKKHFANWLPVILPLALLISQNPEGINAQPQKTLQTMKEILVQSPAFAPGGMIPSKYTCEGDNISPFLGWSILPGESKSIVLIIDDPDAPNGDWVHFILFNIPPETRNLNENFRLNNKPSPLIKAGRNSAGKLEYHGPCPPSGLHRYFFKIFALDIVLNNNEGITKKELLSAIEGHVVAKGELMGKYQKIK